MKLTAWGRYPEIDSNIISADEKLDQRLTDLSEVIPFGNGRSYGDSALSSNIVSLAGRNRFIAFDAQSGLLTCESGVLLRDILEVFVPRGWFLKITPGTKLITLGGAIASDVHGKNHHTEGCFSSCVKEFTLMLAHGEILHCSRKENPDLFHATCGGMGLTGIILDATFYLKRIKSSTINQLTIKSRNLEETFSIFEQYSNYPYSVAWIDCLARGNNLGRSLIMLGEFAHDGNLEYRPGKQHSIPCDFPSFTLNRHSVKAFNQWYYARAGEGLSHSQVNIDSFFYPLDSIGHWNRIYGRCGFTQYQFILPKENSYAGLEEILHQIAMSGKGSFLAVLKLYGPENHNYLSFPLEGYSLALDFKLEPGLFELLDSLDAVVMRHKGRIYLTKDVRVSKQTLRQGYPQLDKFEKVRTQYALKDKFNSLQSKRLDL